ncbi:MAG: endoribonuclease YicC domain-containing protein, partial [Gemmobacter sp.]
AQQRQRFIDRWNEALAAGGPSATGNTVTSDMANDRALTEATAFAIRIDVAEELTRLDSHLTEIERKATSFPEEQLAGLQFFRAEANEMKYGLMDPAVEQIKAA